MAGRKSSSENCFGGIGGGGSSSSKNSFGGIGGGESSASSGLWETNFIFTVTWRVPVGANKSE